LESGGGRRTNQGFDSSRPARSFLEVARGVLVEPAAFFAGLGGPRPDRVKGPLIFAIICALISSPFAFFLQRYDPLAPRQPDMVSGFTSMFRDNPAAAIALAVLLVALLPLFAVLGVYIGAAVQHFFVFLFVRERRGYWGTFPVVAYGGSALALFSWIPILGYLVMLYGVYVTTMGLREMHGTSTARALLAALVPDLFSLLFLVPALFLTPPGT
jgi:hypothetical protein